MPSISVLSNPMPIVQSLRMRLSLWKPLVSHVSIVHGIIWQLKSKFSPLNVKKVELNKMTIFRSLKIKPPF